MHHRLALALLVAPVLAQDAARPDQPELFPKELAQVGASYAAKVTASALFVSHRSLESVQREELAPDAPMQLMMKPFLVLEVDEEAHTVTASMLGATATATCVDGLGCTLAEGPDLAALREHAAAITWPPRPPQPWPVDNRDVDREALGKALEYGFAERAGKPLVRTRAVVVVRRGRLLAERYAEGYGADSVLPGWSMTKTLVDALLGIRVRQGELDPDAPLPVPEWSAADDPRRALRLDDLLRMQSGLRWSESYVSPDSHALRMLFGGTRDFGGVAAGEPLVREPGTEFRYSSGTTNLLCRILRATFADDTAYLAFARETLFSVIGAHSALIEPDPSGTLVGSSFGYATARDWARFGQLYLQDGVWNGTRLLPEGWVRRARTATPSAERGHYGRHLWLNRGPDDEPERRPFARLPRSVCYLSGYEGQYVVCFPEQELVVVRLGCTKRGGFDLHGFLERVMNACSD